MLLLAIEVTLQFDVRPTPEDATDLVHGGGVSAGEAMQTGGVLLDEVPGVTGLAFGVLQRPRGEQLAEIFVAGAILDEEGEGAVMVERRPLRPPVFVAALDGGPFGSAQGRLRGRRSTGFREQQLRADEGPHPVL